MIEKNMLHEEFIERWGRLQPLHERTLSEAENAELAHILTHHDMTTCPQCDILFNKGSRGMVEEEGVAG